MTQSIAIVLVPVTRSECGGVDGGLLVSPVYICPSRVDGKAKHAEQHENQNADQDNRLSTLGG